MSALDKGSARIRELLDARQQYRAEPETDYDMLPDFDEQGSGAGTLQPTTSVRLIKIDISNLASTRLNPVSYAVQQLLPRGVVTLLPSHGGIGKTELALIIVCHVATGSPFIGFAIPGAEKVVFVSLEDGPAILMYRIRFIAEKYGLDLQLIIKNLALVDGSESDGVLVTEQAHNGTKRLFPTAAMQELTELARGAVLIVIDNASDAFDGDENNRRQVRTFIRMLAKIARDNDAAVLLLAHVDKNTAKFGGNGNAYSGSTAWHNSVRSRLVLVEADGAVELRQEKLNVGKKLEAPLLFTWSQHGVLVPAQRHTPAQDEANETDAADRAGVLAAIRAANEHDIIVPTSRAGSNTTLHVLKSVAELPDALKTTKGSARFWASVTALVRQKEIVPVEYRDRHRNPTSRYCVSALVPPIPPVQLTRRTDAPLVGSVDCVTSPATNATNATNAAAPTKGKKRAKRKPRNVS